MGFSIIDGTSKYVSEGISFFLVNIFFPLHNYEVAILMSKDVLKAPSTAG